MEGEKINCFSLFLLTHSPSDSYGASSLPEGAFGGHSPNDVATSVASDIALRQLYCLLAQTMMLARVRIKVMTLIILIEFLAVLNKKWGYKAVNCTFTKNNNK